MFIWQYFSCLLVHIGPTSSNPWCSTPGRDVCSLDVWLHCPLQEMSSSLLVQVLRKLTWNTLPVMWPSPSSIWKWCRTLMKKNSLHNGTWWPSWDYWMELKFWIFRNQTSSITINHRRGNWTTLLESLHLRVFWLHQQYLGDEIPRGHRGIGQGKAQNMAFMSIWGSGNDISNMARHEDRGRDRNELWSFQWKWRVVGEIEEDMMDASPGKRPSSVSHPMISQWFQYKSSDGII